MPSGGAALGGLVDHLFRHAAGQMVSTLARLLGPHRLELAEEAVQEALAEALEVWAYRGVPDNPRGWLFQVARNRALDRLRRENVFLGKAEALAALSESVSEPAGAGGLGDDELIMMFMCCHPALPAPARIALTLKLVSGFSVDEIAAAFLAPPATIAQRLVRAKRQIREDAIPLELPLKGLDERLASVLEVLYLLFNEGYAAHGGDNLTRADLCQEAIRLARLLAANAQTARPAVHALLALMLLQASRLPARTDAMGELLLLSEQDRARWDRGLIAEGMRHLDRAASGTEITPYHIEAAIASCHAVAADVPSTDWRYILRLYDDLLALKPSPVVELNRAIALAMVEGPEEGLRAIEAVRRHPAFEGYYLLPAMLGGLALKAGRRALAAASYREALALKSTAPERRFMLRQLATAEGATPGSPPN
jgi:RNA polymerase sigma-70 factor (ECF subfamily)